MQYVPPHCMSIWIICTSSLFLLSALSLVTLVFSVTHLAHLNEISADWWHSYLILEMQMTVLNREAWCGITKYSQPDGQETKNVTHRRKSGLSAALRLSLAMAEKASQASQRSKIWSCSTTQTFHFLSSRGWSGKQAVLVKTHTCTHTHRLCAYDFGNLVRNSVLECLIGFTCW